jgi:ABC-2 type transport system permease protein
MRENGARSGRLPSPTPLRPTPSRPTPSRLTPSRMTPARLVAFALRPRVPMRHMLLPKWLTARVRAKGAERGRATRIAVLGTLGVGFWAGIFTLLYRLLTYFKGVPEIGPLLAGKLLGLILLSFFSILLLSNVITALSSFFLARDLDLLAAAPVDWLTLYGAKLAETLVHSSWMVLLLATPMFAAYGVVYDGGPLYPLVALAAVLPFLAIPTVLGSALTLLMVNVFPARRTKDILSVIAVVTAAGLVLLFRFVRPEKLARPEGFKSLVEFITILRTPTSPFLPSEWVQRGVMSWLRAEVDVLPFYLLWSTAAGLVVLGALMHRSLYAKGFTKAQESARRATQGRGRAARWLLAPLSARKRELVLKEVRLFFRDTTQWSQLVLLAVLVVVYVFNIKFLPLRGAGMTFLLVNVIPFVNLALAGFVLASVAARFIFPGVSLEGRTLWLLRSSPLSAHDLLWSKFWVGTLPLLVLALAIVGVTDALLGVTPFMFVVSIFSITLITFAVAGLAIGMGTLFPQFETENAAQIPTSFGGLVFMMSAIAVIGGVILLEARPVYGYLSAQAFGTPSDPAEMVIGFSGAAALCLVATFVPLRVAVARLERVER